MHPDYETHRLKRGQPRHAINTLVPKELYDAVVAVSEMEDDNVSGLIVEGLRRVIEERRSDPDFTKKLATMIEQRQQDIDRLRDNPHLNST